MTYKNSEGFPANALIASYVYGVLERRGVLRNSGIAETIREMSDSIPPRLDGDQRTASLAALRALIDNPRARRASVFDWFRI